MIVAPRSPYGNKLHYLYSWARQRVRLRNRARHSISIRQASLPVNFTKVRHGVNIVNMVINLKPKFNYNGLRNKKSPRERMPYQLTNRYPGTHPSQWLGIKQLRCKADKRCITLVSGSLLRKCKFSQLFCHQPSYSACSVMFKSMVRVTLIFTAR